MERLGDSLFDPESKRKMEALRNSAANDLFRWPVLDRKEKWKRRIKKYVFFRNIPPIDHYYWPNALLAEGLSEGIKAGVDGCKVDTLIQYYDAWIEKGLPVYCLDNGANGMPLLDLYEYTGEIKYLDSAGQLADYLKMQKRGLQDILPYRPWQENHVYADGLGMVCPFLCRYGKLTEKEEMKQLGVVQLICFLKKGMDGKSGLPYHGYNSQTGEKYGTIGWGRAVGWLLLGMARSLICMDEKRDGTGDLWEHFENLTEAVLDYQREDGSFAWLLPALEGPGDTSATAMIACALLEGWQEKNPDRRVERAVRQAAGFLLSQIRDGRVTQCSAECGGFGEYPQRYGSYPWGDGPALRLFGLLKGAESGRKGTVDIV